MNIARGCAVCSEGDAESLASPVIYVQMLGNKMAPTLKCTVLVPYQIHVLFMNCSAKYCCWLVGYGHNVVIFVSVMIENDLKYSCSFHVWQSSAYYLSGTDEVLAKETGRFTKQMNARKKKISLSKHTMMETLRSLADARYTRLEVD